jgi:hypothetical protein
MNTFPEGSIPYIMGSYEYYPGAAGVFSFNGDGSAVDSAPNDLWFAQPQPIYANDCENFLFDSNPHMVSAAGDAPLGTMIDNKHYDNPVHISSWISTASPAGQVVQSGQTNANFLPGTFVPAGNLQGFPGTMFPPNQEQLHVTSDQAPPAGYFDAIGDVDQDYSSPMYSSSAASFSTPYGRVVSTSTSASSCPGTGSTLATPRFDNAHLPPYQTGYGDPRFHKSSWPNPVTPETSDVFTSVPLAPPQIGQPAYLSRPVLARLSGESPAIAVSQDQFANVPRLSANGRSLRSTPSIESLQEFVEEQDAQLPPSGLHPLMSPFSSTNLKSMSMNRTCSAPGSFLDQRPEDSRRRQSRQSSNAWSSPFTSEPLTPLSCANADENRNSESKALKRKPSMRALLVPPAMVRSLTANELPSSPLWTAWGPQESSLNDAPMIRSASAINLTYATSGIDSFQFAPGYSTGWTSQVPQPKRSEVGLQAVEVDHTPRTDAFTSIPASVASRTNAKSSPFSSEPRNITVPGTATPRKTKKLPKHAQSNTSGVKLTFMNFGPNDGDEITSAVAESGKSKRRRPDDCSSGDEHLAVMKRSKSSASASASS